MVGPAASDVALRVSRVEKSFHAGKRSVVALRDVSLQISFGNITGLIGPD